MIHFTNFRKSFGHSLILDIDDLKLETGAYWVRGVNGSGKTTLLKVIAGILDFEGDIYVDQNLSIKNNSTAYRRLVNFAEAEPVYPGFVTGTDMIALFSQAKGAAAEQALHYVRQLKMTDYIREPLSTYSSGMIKKLSLVLAFLGQPKLILLDEPLITLDDESLDMICQWITDLHTRDNVSFILSSHQPLYAEHLRLKELFVQQKTLNRVS